MRQCSCRTSIVGELGAIERNIFAISRLPRRVKIGGIALGCKLPVYPSEPTCGGTASTGAMGHYLTHAPQHTASRTSIASMGANKYRGRHGEAERVDD